MKTALRSLRYLSPSTSANQDLTGGKERRRKQWINSSNLGWHRTRSVWINPPAPLHVCGPMRSFLHRPPEGSWRSSSRQRACVRWAEKTNPEMEHNAQCDAWTNLGVSIHSACFSFFKQSVFAAGWLALQLWNLPPFIFPTSNREHFSGGVKNFK